MVAAREAHPVHPRHAARRHGSRAARRSRWTTGRHRRSSVSRDTRHPEPADEPGLGDVTRLGAGRGRLPGAHHPCRRCRRRADARAADFVKGLHAAGHRVAVCTNASEKPPRRTPPTCATSGIPIADEDFVTAGSAAADYIAHHHPGARVLAVGGEGITAPLRDRGLVLHDGGDRPPSTQCSSGPRRPTPTPTSTRPAWPWSRAPRSTSPRTSRGSTAAAGAALPSPPSSQHAITWVTKVDAVVTGKPSAVLAESLLARLDREPGRVAVVGDARGRDPARPPHGRPLRRRAQRSPHHRRAIAALAPPPHPDPSSTTSPSCTSSSPPSTTRPSE